MTTGLWCMALVAMATMQTWAATVDAESARQIATQFVKSRVARQLMSPRAVTMSMVHVEPSAVKEGVADYYVLNATDGNAFVIVAGDDRAEEVLGYGEGRIDMSDLPCNLRWLLNSYKEQMEYLHSHPQAQVQRVAPYNDVTIAPMVTCNWNQREPFNNQCPMYEGERSVTGCVATAMAQVMYYWRFPERTPSLSGYTTRSHHIYLPSLPSQLLEWDDMIDSYNVDYEPRQGEAVALLMRYCGQSCRMDYSPTGSGSYVSDQLQGMRSFGYSWDAAMLDRSGYSLEEWDALLQQDLLAGRPVLYSGADPMSGGHAFVLDGYYDGKYHINWGWGGTGDGYFALGAFNVRGYKFSTQQQMLHCVHPTTTAVVEAGYDFVADGIYYMYDEEATGLLVTYKDTRYDCYSGEVTIPSQVTHDGETLPVVGIGKSAFRNCVGLTAVNIPSTVSLIDSHAFNGCINLRGMTLPGGVTTIGSQAFAYCYGMTRLELPAGLKTIDERAFVDCNGLERVEIPDLDAWMGISFADALSNPLSSAHHLFVAGEEVTDLEFIGSRVDSIRPYAFTGCTGLSRVMIDGPRSVGRAAFKDCTGLVDLAFSTGDTPRLDIGREAFAGCTGLTTVSLPQSVDRVSHSMFASCTGLQTVEIASSVTDIETAAFDGCTALSAVTMPSSVTTVGTSAFEGCTGLTRLSLSESLTSLGASAFSGCSKLTAVVIPNSVKTMGRKAFFDCIALKSVVLPDSLSMIDNQAFAQCEALTSITIPDGVRTIDEKAFYKCLYLNDVTVGRSVELIKESAFDNNPRIKSVTSLAMVPPEIEYTNTFMRSIYRTATLRVPAAVLNDYKNSGIWSWFVNIEGMIDPMRGDVNGDGEVNIADVNALINAILMRQALIDSMDVNCDGEVNIADVNTVLDMILE